jgi:CubicO group peptidase (beta-lactamase class C family)
LKKLLTIFLLLTYGICSGQNIIPLALPESMGYSTNFFTDLGKEANNQIPSLGSFLVWKHDALIYEGYFHNQNRNTAFEVKSVTKSVMSAIIGAAIYRGYLHNLDTLVLNFFPEYERHYPTQKEFEKESWQDADSALHLLTLRHLLTMQTGFDYTENSSITRAYSNSSDPVRFTLELGFTEDPGEKFNYCSPAAHLSAVILAKLLNTDLRDFADSTLFKPAGISLKKWEVDAKGRYLGASGMQFSSQDMIRFGVLYLKKGKVNGKQILPEEWIKESTAKQVELNNWDVLPNANGYGYFWWRRNVKGHQMYIASGYGGQLICVIPDLDMVIATTCTLGDNNRGRSEIKRLHLLIDKIINVSK